MKNFKLVEEFESVTYRRKIVGRWTPQRRKIVRNWVQKHDVGRIPTNSPHDCSGKLCRQWCTVSFFKDVATITFSQYYDV